MSVPPADRIDEFAPDPPEGYRAPWAFSYPVLAVNLAAAALGYRVSYGVATNVGGFYAAAFGQFQPREHLLPVALAPLVALDAVGLAPLAFAPPPVAAAAFGGLLVDTSGAAGDLYAAAVALRLPGGRCSTTSTRAARTCSNRTERRPGGRSGTRERSVSGAAGSGPRRRAQPTVAPRG